MGETVYLLGAGVNQVIKDWDGHKPPLLTNFFSIALQKRKFNEDHYVKQIQDVYDYIEKHFKKTRADLVSSPFDLELCFTLLEKQMNQAMKEKRIEEVFD